MGLLDLFIKKDNKGTVRESLSHNKSNELDDDDIRKMRQRRSFLRYDLELKVSFKRIVCGYTTRGSFNAETVDLSAGGLKLKTQVVMEIGDNIELTINLTNGSIVAKGEVIRLDPTRGGMFYYAFRFTEIDEKDREEIVKFIFNSQRERLKKLGTR